MPRKKQKQIQVIIIEFKSQELLDAYSMVEKEGVKVFREVNEEIEDELVVNILGMIDENKIPELEEEFKKSQDESIKHT